MIPRMAAMKKFVFCVAMLCLASLGVSLATMAGMTSDHASAMQKFYWYVLPALPFALLLVAALCFPRWPQERLLGAAGGAVVAVGLPHVIMAIVAATNRDSGVHIGFSLIFMAMPFFLPLFMAGGAAMPGVIRGRRR